MVFEMRDRLLAVALVVMLLVGCSSVPPRAQPLNVVTTIAPFAEWTQVIGGERVAVQTIVPVGVDPQTFEPTDQQRKQIIAADVVILNGLGLEPWLDDILTRSQSEQIVVELAQFVDMPAPLITAPTPQAGLGAQAIPTSQPTPYPIPGQELSRYLWLSPRTAIGQIDMIARALTRADPAGFPDFRQRSARYSADIENLDGRIQKEVATWPQPEIWSSNGFLYPFTQRYSIRLETLDADATEHPSGAPVFINRFAADREASALPSGAVVLDPLGAATYEELMNTLVVSMTAVMDRPE